MTTERRLAKLPQALLWVFVGVVCFFAAQYMAAYGVLGLSLLGLHLAIDSTTGLLVYRMVIYMLTAGLIALALWYRYRRISLKDIALTRLLTWRDMGLAALGAIVYVVGTTLALSLAGSYFGVDTAQAQDLGFSYVMGGEQLAAFIVLVVLTPLFEEAIFRGFLYGRLRMVRVPKFV